MAFDLKTNNLTGVAVIDQPGGVLATNANFITLYDYAMQYQPELVKELHYANGKGSITGLLALLAGEKTYAADVVQHMEMNRLHNKLKNVTVVGNNFTSPTAHNLRPNMVIKISDGVKEVQAYVQSITSPTVFVALNDKAGAYGFIGAVDIVADFANRWDKGSKSFVKGRTWNPKKFENFTHITKERYDVNESDMAHTIWLDTPDGPRWCNTELERTNTLFDNIIELTQFFHERADAGADSTVAGVTQGMNGIIPTVEKYGNISNSYIQTIGDLQNIAKRIKLQTDCTEYTFWSNHEQMNFFNAICAGVNASFVNGANYGAFNNDKDMALALDFASIFVSGITFHFTSWKLLDDPTLMSGGKFDTTGIAYFGLPMGKQTVQNADETTEVKPYLTIYNRVKGNVNRKRKATIFGLGGTPQEDDKMTMQLLNESTNQLVGANAFFVGRRGAYYTGA
jgi:hypothetical protein